MNLKEKEPIAPELIPLWAHQREAVERAKNLDEFALFFQVGTGKTATCINILRHKYAQNKRLLRTLILCPPIVIHNWQNEIKMHSKIKEWDIIPLVKSQKERCLAMKTFAFRHDEKLESVPAGKIVITNYEAMLMLDLLKIIHKWQPEVIVCDESHRCKDPTAKRTKAVLDVAKSTRHRYILTGTPILNSAMDIFSQFLILDKGEAFGKNFFSFRAHYFYDKNAYLQKTNKYFPNWIPREKMVEEMNALIAEKSMRALKADCLDLPPLVTQNVYVELTPSQQRLYDSMKKDFVAYLGDQACVATLAITKALRLMQIASGFINVEGMTDGVRKNIELADNPRSKALEELLREITPHSKVLVWAVFKENYNTIRGVCESLGVDFVEVHGDVSAAQKQENVQKFNADSKCRVLVGHPGSAGIGINLVAASYSIFYSRNFSLEQDLQAEARNYRAGSEMHVSVTRINIVAKDTIDEHITEALAKKQGVAEVLLTLRKKLHHEGEVNDGFGQGHREDLSTGL